MKKVGICTFYYKTRNYGANLQAYALQKIVGNMGDDVKFIAYSQHTFLHELCSDIKHYIQAIGRLSNDLKIRNKSFDVFNNELPHTRKYHKSNIKNANKEFDAFIVGSDQVWNPNWTNSFFTLTFANKNKLKIAYAASTGKIHLNDKQKSILKTALDNTDYISIREKESIPDLQELTEKEINYVLDPTMLLGKNDWDLICSPRLIKGKYMFCYFLGSNATLRNVAKKYAKEKNLKLVTIPYLNGKYRKVDDGFGDIQLYNISPKDFISLIKYASFVMTDSFHCAVFSHIYETPFVVSGGGKDGMGCRMISLTELFGTENRYIPEHDDVTTKKLSEIDNQPFVVKKEKYLQMKDFSLKFLEKALNYDNM